MQSIKNYFGNSMLLKAKVEKDQIIFENKQAFEDLMKKFDGKDIIIEICQNKGITTQQMKALHLWFENVAKTFTDAGLDIKKTLSTKIDHHWTAELVKELMWRPVQQSYLGKKSVKNLKAEEISAIFDIINRHNGENFGIYEPFPDQQELYYKNN